MKRRQKLYDGKIFPWQAIADDFVRGHVDGDNRYVFPTIKDICDKYGCSYSQTRRIMFEEDWIAQRNAWRAEQLRNVKDKSIQNFEATVAHFDASCMEAAQAGIDHILQHFREADAAQTPLPGVEIDRLSRAMVGYQRVGRLVLGLSTDNNSNRTKIENIAQEAQLDLSQLTDKELQILEILAKRLEDRTATEPEKKLSNGGKSKSLPMRVVEADNDTV